MTKHRFAWTHSDAELHRYFNTMPKPNRRPETTGSALVLSALGWLDVRQIPHEDHAMLSASPSTMHSSTSAAVGDKWSGGVACKSIRLAARFRSKVDFGR
jgi:hypothetical protein